MTKPVVIKPTMCVNGCDRPIQPPSEVVCGDCLRKITQSLKDILDEMQAHARALDEARREGGR